MLFSLEMLLHTTFTVSLIVPRSCGAYVMLILALLMRPVDKDAARRSTEWLIANGVVKESERPQIERIGRYLTNYNLVLVLTASFGLFFLRYKMRVPSDKSV